MADPRYSLFAARAVFDPRLTATDVRVLAALGTYSNKQGWCNPKQETIALRVGLSRPTVVAAIKRLTETGYLEHHPQTAAGRGKIASKYRVKLDIEDPMSASLTSGADVSPADVGEADTGGADVSLTAGPMSSQLNMQKEHSHKNDTSTLLQDRARKFDPELWKARVAEAIALAGPALLPTNPVHRMPTVFRLLCEPVSGEPCDWELDVLPAIAAASTRSARFDKWDYIKPAALENRDRRLAGLPAPQAPQPLKTNGASNGRGTSSLPSDDDWARAAAAVARNAAT